MFCCAIPLYLSLLYFTHPQLLYRAYRHSSDLRGRPRSSSCGSTGKNLDWEPLGKPKEGFVVNRPRDARIRSYIPASVQLEIGVIHLYIQSRYPVILLPESLHHVLPFSIRRLQLHLRESGIDGMPVTWLGAGRHAYLLC